MGRGGVEPPTHGFSVRCQENTTNETINTCGNQQPPLTPQLTPESQKQAQLDISKLPSELTEVVSAWPNLPEHIKTAIMSLVNAANQKG
jgi:hypothetical protein